MIKIEFNEGKGLIRVKGSDKLLEIEMSIMIGNLIKESPELFIKALMNNVEILEKEVKS